jgi:signal transduction histidine kinase
MALKSGRKTGAKRRKRKPSASPLGPGANDAPESASFSVDTRLFRELGELLVGRESTALAELIKNSYDADANKVVVHAEGLQKKPAEAFIVVSDDGNGMSEPAFRNGFLRIAARGKVDGSRRSPRRNRRYTGEKGVGRLAAHKLASHLEVESRHTKNLAPPGDPQFASEMVRAKIDWDLVEQAETIDRIPQKAVVLTVSAPLRHATTGTKLKLTRLRTAWTRRMIDEFVKGCLALTPNEALVKPLDGEHFAGPGIIGDARRDSNGLTRDFEIDLQGEFQPSEEFQTSTTTKAILCIEIRSDASKGLVEVSITPSKKWQDEKGMELFSDQIPMRDVLARVEKNFGFMPKLSFTARIFERHGASRPAEGKHESGWPSHASGVRIFMEGFRVLPYAETTDDWLSLKADVIGRDKAGLVLPDYFGESGDSVLQGSDTDALALKSDRMYMGAVFLTHEGTPDLKMLINREGFLPGASMEALADIIRVGINLATRLRRAVSAPTKRSRAEAGEELASAANVAPPDSAPTSAYVTSRLEAVTKAIAKVDRKKFSKEENDSFASAKKGLDEVKAVADELFTEQAMIRVLASLGTQLSAFSHEVAHLIPVSNSVLEGIVEARKQVQALKGITPKALRDLGLAEIKLEAELLLRSLERQATYLVDVSGTAARRRRSKQSISDRFDRAADLFRGEIERLEIHLASELPSDWHTTPMFAAEVTMVFANLVSNAIKAAGKGGRIVAREARTNQQRHFRLENTGSAVDLPTAEKWFRPFRSNAPNPDHTLGQGMGLGLTITRSILDEYGAVIGFVKPSRGFASAIEVTFPIQKK